jgi:hypothetical protein
VQRAINPSSGKQMCMLGVTPLEIQISKRYFITVYWDFVVHSNRDVDITDLLFGLLSVPLINPNLHKRRLSLLRVSDRGRG